MFQRYDPQSNFAVTNLTNELKMRPLIPPVIDQKLKERKEKNSLRELNNLDHLIDFSSNDYLGLSRNPDLISSIQATRNSDEKIGGTGSRLISGNHVGYGLVEEYLSKIFYSEAVLLFNSGYAANQGVISCIPQRGDTILYDQLSHVCIKEGAWLSKAQSISFKHNELQDLESKLSRSVGNCYVVTETVFSMDGDIAPLEEICSLCEKYQAWLIVDEAHSTGVYGQQGAGYLVAKGLSDRVLARIYTFGKAIGMHGAAVAGSQSVIDYLINFSRPFIYTTSLPFHTVSGIKNAFEYLGSHAYLQRDLQRKIEIFRNEFKRSVSNTAIQPILIKGNEKARRAAEKLQTEGFDVRAILSPTVKEGEERLRISLHVHNSAVEIKQLASLIHSVI